MSLYEKCSDKQLKDRIKELEFYKEPSFQQLPLEETVYCFSTDIENVFKIGKTINFFDNR
jgi:hypothetical protein